METVLNGGKECLLWAFQGSGAEPWKYLSLWYRGYIVLRNHRPTTSLSSFWRENHIGVVAQKAFVVLLFSVIGK